MAINVVAITGRMTRDPEIRQTKSGVRVCSFAVAVDRAYKSGEERQADFIDCIAWQHSADFLEKYFHKGEMIGITGHLQTRNWETDDGQKRKSTEIVVDSLSFVGGKKSTYEAPAENQAFTEIDVDTGVLPF